MPCPREKRETLELQILSPFAAKAALSRGRAVDEPPCELRTCFQRDTDRIVHSKAFRRLKHKTQVFLEPEGDHYRTRMTHTLEVSRIARTIARALDLNEDLTEAAALGHDLGHTPFGHAGERALNQLCPFPFEHNQQSLRVVDCIEKDGRGLNLSWEVRRAILCHTGDELPETLEGQILRIADRIAYINHDVDDAIRGGILREEDIPEEIVTALGADYSTRIDSMIQDIVSLSQGRGRIEMSPEMYFIMESFRDFMFESVYKNPVAKGEEGKAMGILTTLYEYYLKHPEELPEDYRALLVRFGAERAVCDYIAGMTDTYAVYLYSRLFIPAAWTVR